MWGLGVAFGILVGFALGLTGGGGSIFAVPLLVYGLGVPAHEAVGISLASVGATSFVGALQRWRAGELEPGVGMLFAGGGIAGAPLGSWLNGLLPAHLLLLLFAGLMLVVAAHMWRKASRRPGAPAGGRAPTCSRDPTGRLTWTSRLAVLLTAVGLLTGILSGMFGVGGGFVIVPALMFFSGMTIRHAVATSMMAITLISASGVSAYLLAGRPLSLEIAGAFVLGGLLGLVLGTLVGRRISGPQLQKMFAGFIVAVAAFVIAKSVG